MRTKGIFFIISCILFTSITFLLFNHTVNGFLSLEYEKRENLRSEWLKNEISRYAVSEDDLMLNNSIENLLKQPEVLKVTVIHKGRVIADSNPADINSNISSPLLLTAAEIEKKTLLQRKEFRFDGKEYQLILKINNNYAQPLKDSLMLQSGASCIIFLFAVIFIFFPAKDKNNSIGTAFVSQKEDCFFSTCELLLNSKTAVFLVLSGDNRILKASRKALETFGPDIEGNHITELANFNLLTEYFENGRKPYVKDGKKYLVL
ncbi:MAG: hypothetical protein V1752_07955 [Candidatus Firestonebacteria bacterium]